MAGRWVRCRSGGFTLVVACVVSVQAFAVCPPFLVELPALGDPPEAARVQPMFDVGCPDVARVSATLFAGDEQINSRSFYEPALANPPLVYPVRESRSLPNIAGVYRLEWETEFVTGELQRLTQSFVIPCPAPARVSPTWNDADAQLSFTPELGDACEGETQASLSVQDITGGSVVDGVTGTYKTDADSLHAVVLQLPRLEGERRYTGELLLTNRSRLTTSVPVDFVTGCGPVVPDAMIINGRLLGSLQASECNFPIRMEVDAVHSSGESIQRFTATLEQPSFDFAIPGFDAWPAGEIDVQVEFIGATSRARQHVPVAVACQDPAFGTPTLTESDTSNVAQLEFRLEGRNPCQGTTKVTAQVRTIDRAVVFNRVTEVAASPADTPFIWSFPAVPGNTYEVVLRAEYGVGQGQSVERTRRSAFECTAPEILQLGYANPEGSHVSALLSMAQCNAPATAQMLVRNADGRIVAEGDPAILQHLGTSFATLDPTSLGHLPSGEFKAELTVVDNRGRIATAKTPLQRNVVAPKVTFALGATPITPGEIPVLNALDQLVLGFSGPVPPLGSFQPLEGSLARFPGNASTTFHQVDGEMTPQMWFGGVVDAPHDDDGLIVLGVALRDPDGQRWFAPVTRTHIPSTESEILDFHPSRARVAFRAVARIQTLAPGTYALEGAVIEGSGGRQFLVPGTATFRVSTLAGRRHESVLRRGVTEIPVALTWRADNTAQLERITSVPDGDYTLSVVARDQYGNPSEVHALSFRLDQEKRTAKLQWPAVAGYQRVVQHRFHPSVVTQPGPLRALLRRTGGYGDLRINGQRVTDQSVEVMLMPAPDGSYPVTIELLNSDVDGRFVIHPDSTEAIPLELAISTYRPEFTVQRIIGDGRDVLTILSDPQPCRHVIFDDLSRVTLRPDEVLCAVRLAIPGTLALSVTDHRTEIELPADVPPSAMYEEGFIRLDAREPVFQATRQVPLQDLQAYSSTPQVEFVPLPRWRNRSAPGAHLTSIGDVVAGHVVIRAGLEPPVIFVNDDAIEVPPGQSGDFRLPLRTRLAAVGDRHPIRLRAYYPSAPGREVVKQLDFVAVPEDPVLRATGGRFVFPEPVELELRLATVGASYDIQHHGAYDLISLKVVNRDRPDLVLPVPQGAIDQEGQISVQFEGLLPGRYRLIAELRNTHPRYQDALAPLVAETAFEVADGSPIQAQLFTFRESDKVPFFGQIVLNFSDPARRRDIDRVAWETSEDGQTFTSAYCCGATLDFALADPETRYFRAHLTNRHSGENSYTRPIQLRSFVGGELQVEGPRHTFRGVPARYHVSGLPPDQDLFWRVLAPNGLAPQVYRGPSLEIAAEETGRYLVEVVADTGTTSPDDPAAFRAFFTLTSSWPRLPASVIAGPTELEFGKSVTFTVSHPPIFPDRGNPLVVREGEWELPDGTRVTNDEWVEFTLRGIPDGHESVNIYYHTWLAGDRTTITTAVHRVYPVRYDWPDWQLKAHTNSLHPPAVVRLSVAPAKWEEWMGLGSYPIQTHWELPSHLRIIHRTPTEAVIYAPDDRPFNVTARITDPRGNITELRKPNVRPAHRVPFEIAVRPVPERTLLTAPIDVKVHADAVVVPQGRRINRAAFYLNGIYIGVTDGAPFDMRIQTPGEHEIRVIASVDGEFTAADSTTLNIGHNLRATCTISPVGDFRMNGLARASCDDPDGHMVEYRWYADGQLLSESGTRVTLSRSQLHSITELSLIAVDNGGLETTARYVVPPRDTP